MWIRFHVQMGQQLPPEERDKDTHRSVIAAMEGFSFSALLALCLVDAKLNIDLNLPIYFIFLSFTCYLAAFNLQGYKNFRWQDLLSDVLMECGSLTLLLTITSILAIHLYSSLHMALSVLVLVVWLYDHVLRYRKLWRHLEGVTGMKTQMPEYEVDPTKLPKKQIDWDHCGRHNWDYPKGGRCPHCELEEMERQKRQHSPNEPA